MPLALRCSQHRAYVLGAISPPHTETDSADLIIQTQHGTPGKLISCASLQVLQQIMQLMEALHKSACFATCIENGESFLFENTQRERISGCNSRFLRTPNYGNENFNNFAPIANAKLYSRTSYPLGIRELLSQLGRNTEGR